MLCNIPVEYSSLTVLNSWHTCRKMMPKARAKLLAVVDIVGGSWVAATAALLVVVRRNADGSMNTNPDPLVNRTDDRFASRLRMAHCIDCGAKLLR